MVVQRVLLQAAINPAVKRRLTSDPVAINHAAGILTSSQRLRVTSRKATINRCNAALNRASAH